MEGSGIYVIMICYHQDGKGLGNGYPVSAVIMTEELGQMAATDGFHYAQSHQNDPMGAAIALQVLEVIENENLLAHGRKMGEYLRTWYHQLQKVTGCISEIRGIGMMNCIQLKDSYKEEDMIVLDQRLCQAGFLVAVKPTQRVIRTYAPLILNEKMIDAYCIELKSLLI